MDPLLLLDPGLVLPEKSNNPQTLSAFWLRFNEWICDDRSRLGTRAYNELCLIYGNLDATEYVPVPLRRIVHSSIGRILSKPPIVHDVSGREATLTVKYVALATNERILLDDLIGTSSNPSLILGTDATFWDPPPTTIGCVPAPPACVTIHLRPGLPTPEERLIRMTHWFRERRIVVVGGQEDRCIRRILFDKLGVDSTSFTWIPSEHNKRASNIPAVIGGLEPETSIVVCITGKVGHTTSGSVETACKKANIPFNFVEHSSGLRDLLRELFEADQ